MLTRERLEFILKITDYFHGHYEDYGWGHRAINQVLILLSVHTLAYGIADTAVRQAVQGTVEKAMANAAQAVMSSQEPTTPIQQK